MFTIEYRINGTIIGVVYGHNDGLDANRQDKKQEVCRYTWRYHDIGDGVVYKGEISHDRAAGLLVLVAKITIEAEKQKASKVA